MNQQHGLPDGTNNRRLVNEDEHAYAVRYHGDVSNESYSTDEPEYIDDNCQSSDNDDIQSQWCSRATLYEPLIFDHGCSRATLREQIDHADDEGCSRATLSTQQTGEEQRQDTVTSGCSRATLRTQQVGEEQGLVTDVSGCSRATLRHLQVSQVSETYYVASDGSELYLWKVWAVVAWWIVFGLVMLWALVVTEMNEVNNGFRVVNGAAQGGGTCVASCTPNTLDSPIYLDNELSTDDRGCVERSLSDGLVDNDGETQCEYDSELNNSHLEQSGDDLE